MAHFRGVVQGNRGEATRNGSKGSGLDVIAASWNGCIVVELHHDEATGEDKYTVRQGMWFSGGIEEVIAEGVIGQPHKEPEKPGDAGWDDAQMKRNAKGPMRVFKDGDMWCATYEDFKNIAFSVAGFGPTPESAISALRADTLGDKANEECGEVTGSSDDCGSGSASNDGGSVRGHEQADS